MAVKEIADIHCHILANTDDGAKNQEEMYSMLRQAYDDGTRKICLTPHYEVENFGENASSVDAAFLNAKRYATENLPGLSLYLGSEISYRNDSVECLRQGKCHSIAGGRYILVDFFCVPTVAVMDHCLEPLWCAGYIPIVAHVERYPFMIGKIREVAAMAAEGVIFQVNSTSLMSDRKNPERKMAEKLISHGLIDVISSDAHNTDARSPKLSACREYVSAQYGEEYAELLFRTNPEAILKNQTIRF